VAFGLKSSAAQKEECSLFPYT